MGIPQYSDSRLHRAISCVGSSWFVEFRGLGVECSLYDPKVVGSNTGGAEIGLHDFHNLNTGSVVQAAVIESC